MDSRRSGPRCRPADGGLRRFRVLTVPADSGSPACALGIDLGTSSAKAVVAGADGAVLAQASAGYAVTSAVAGYAESEPRDWWNAVAACVREAVAAAGARPSAIGLSGQMHGLVHDVPGRPGAAPGPAVGRQPGHRVPSRLPDARRARCWPGWPTR